MHIKFETYGKIVSFAALVRLLAQIRGIAIIIIIIYEIHQVNSHHLFYTLYMLSMYQCTMYCAQSFSLLPALRTRIYL